MRFYIDERGGCIAVRDHQKDNDWEGGLHPETDGVMAYWSGFPDYDEYGMTRWNIHEWQRERAIALCEELNSKA